MMWPCCFLRERYCGFRTGPQWNVPKHRCEERSWPDSYSSGRFAWKHRHTQTFDSRWRKRQYEGRRGSHTSSRRPLKRWNLILTNVFIALFDRSMLASTTIPIVSNCCWNRERVLRSDTAWLEWFHCTKPLVAVTWSAWKSWWPCA